MLGVVVVRALTNVTRKLFSFKVRRTKVRGSHPKGFGAAGRAEITWNEAFAPPMFAPGETLGVILRHSTIFRTDDASLDGRGIGVRLTSTEGESMSLLGNTSPQTPFWDTPSMFRFFAGVGGNEESVRKWVTRSSRVEAAWRAGLSREPKSLAELAYWAPQPIRMDGADGVARAVRFRVRGAGVDPETANQLSEQDAKASWAFKRHPSSTVPVDYLREEYRTRIEAGPVRYLLEAQYQKLDTMVEPDSFAGDIRWDETESPWIEVAVLTVDRMLDPAEEDQIRLNPGELPTGFELFRPAGPADPNSVLWIRTHMYHGAQEARRPHDRTAGQRPTERSAAR